jgi:hypothetical protein
MWIHICIKMMSPMRICINLVCSFTTQPLCTTYTYTVLYTVDVCYDLNGRHHRIAKRTRFPFVALALVMKIFLSKSQLHNSFFWLPTCVQCAIGVLGTAKYYLLMLRMVSYFLNLLSLTSQFLKAIQSIIVAGVHDGGNYITENLCRINS